MLIFIRIRTFLRRRRVAGWNGSTGRKKTTGSSNFLFNFAIDQNSSLNSAPTVYTSWQSRVRIFNEAIVGIICIIVPSIRGIRTATRRCVVAHRVLPKFPLLSTNGARIFAGGRVEPFADALQMKGVSAFAPYDRTVFTGVLDSGADPFKGRLTYTADVVVGVPTPGSDRVEALDADFERHGRLAAAVGCCIFGFSGCGRAATFP